MKKYFEVYVLKYGDIEGKSRVWRIEERVYATDDQVSKWIVEREKEIKGRPYWFMDYASTNSIDKGLRWEVYEIKFVELD